MQRETSQERDLSFDGYSAVWMTDDDGSPMCDRCEALLNGAKLNPPLEITKPADNANVWGPERMRHDPER